MIKVRVNCPVSGCGNQVQAKSLDRHLEKVHELTGVVTLRLHPVSPYQHEPEARGVELAPEEERGGEQEQAQAPEPELEPKTEPELEPKTEPEP